MSSTARDAGQRLTNPADPYGKASLLRGVADVALQSATDPVTVLDQEIEELVRSIAKDCGVNIDGPEGPAFRDWLDAQMFEGWQ